MTERPDFASNHDSPATPELRLADWIERHRACSSCRRTVADMEWLLAELERLRSSGDERPGTRTWGHG